MAHGKEYRAKLTRKDQPTQYSDWFNTMAELQREMERITRPEGVTYVAQQRDVLCPECAATELKIEDVSPL
jgi:hypothetical protein